ncbi:MAG TPA: DUF885 domain-containing protein [Steroidobacteraceae bacterium]|nr:DUF885 domain-containing protein [Steroidobacteraceae bacterium]
MTAVRHSARSGVALLATLAAGISFAAAPQAGSARAAQALQQLLERERQYELSLDPIRSSAAGERAWNDRWPDFSLAAFQRREEHARTVLAQLDALDANALSAADRLDYDLFREQREVELEELELRWYLVPIRHNVGIHALGNLPQRLRFKTSQDYADWLQRLRSYSAYVDQTIALMREGMRTGIVFPRDAMQRVPGIIERQLLDDPTAHTFYEPFLRIPDTIRDAAALRAQGQQAIAGGVLPALRRLRAFFIDEYIPACPVELGVWRMPQGERIYAHFIRRNTTLRTDPAVIHQRGLDEVKRIRGRMEAAIARSGFKGSFAEFTEHLRTDPQFYYTSSDELLTAYRALAKRVDPLLVKVFRTLPRMPYGIEPAAGAAADDSVAGAYAQGTADGERAGGVVVNVSNPRIRPKYEMLNLIMHEGVPGHHIQRALAMELGDVPEFRRSLRSPVFSEGWALYAESLGYDMGLFDDPYAEFGALSFEMWRAIRLVVDTGIHWGRWDRERAVAYFRENSARPVADILQEVDRYAEIPAQALAYKTGEMKIKELRARATAALGPAFDLREFHKVVLEQGTIPLGPLERHVDAWIAKHSY